MILGREKEDKRYATLLSRLGVVYTYGQQARGSETARSRVLKSEQRTRGGREQNNERNKRPRQLFGKVWVCRDEEGTLAGPVWVQKLGGGVDGLLDGPDEPRSRCLEMRGRGALGTASAGQEASSVSTKVR